MKTLWSKRLYCRIGICFLDSLFSSWDPQFFDPEFSSIFGHEISSLNFDSISFWAPTTSLFWSQGPTFGKHTICTKPFKKMQHVGFQVYIPTTNHWNVDVKNSIDFRYRFWTTVSHFWCSKGLPNAFKIGPKSIKKGDSRWRNHDFCSTWTQTAPK